MILKPAIWAAGVVAMALSSVQACDYERMTVELVQCRPVDLTETDRIATRIVCQCDYRLSGASGECMAQKTQRPSYLTETSDILATCAKGPALCEPACGVHLN